MKRCIIIPVCIFVTGCTYDLELRFDQKDGVVEILFYRSILGIHYPFKMNCLTGMSVKRTSDKHVVWELQRETSSCYSGSSITFGRNVPGYSYYAEPLKPGTTYNVSVFGSGVSGNSILNYELPQRELELR